MLIPKRKRKLDKKYLAEVRKLDCVQCGRSPCDANHKVGAGMGLKSDDDLTFPLCRIHHIEFHRNPVKWQEKYGSEMMHIKRTQQIIKRNQQQREWFES